MSRSPYRGGGFIWALVDEGLKRSDTGQIDVAGNRAPDGILGPYRQKEASFYTVKELWSPIALQPLERAESGDFRFAVENRHSFLDARQCRFTWQSRRFRGPAERKSGFSVIAEGALSIASIPPGDRGELTVPYLKAQLAAADALAPARGRSRRPGALDLGLATAPGERLQPLATRPRFRRLAARHRL